MAQLPPFIEFRPEQRNWSGWIVLAILFGLLIPTTILQSFQGTDLKSTNPVVQAGNLEAIVDEETPKDRQTSELEGVVRAIAAKHATDEDASAVFAAAMVELHKPVTAADVAPLAKSKVAARRTAAELYAGASLPPARIRELVAQLPQDRYLYKLAKAQFLERLGDRSTRREVSPALDPAALVSKERPLAVLFSLALFVGGLVIVGYIASLATGAVKWRGHPVEPATLADADRLALRAAQMFGLFLAVEFAVAAFVEGAPGLKSPMILLAAEIFSAVAIVIGIVLITQTQIGGKSYRLADYGLTKGMVLGSLLWGVGGLFAVVPLATVGLLVGTLVEHVAPRPDHPLMHMLEDPHNVFAVAGALFLASVQAPFTEELLFRGTLTPALSGLFRGRRYAAAIAIGVSSLVFASIHPQGFTLWLPLASVGVVNGVLCYQTRSVLPGMVMHCLFNAVAISYTLIIR